MPQVNHILYILGVIIEINSKWYILTSHHVLFDERNNCERKIMSIESIYKKKINWSTDYLFFKSDDLALIPITPIDDHNPAKIY